MRSPLSAKSKGSALSAGTDSRPPETVDRRVRRTRSAIVSAFNRLILEGGYASVTPAAIAAAAGVGRSTFYEHFGGVDDVLGQTLATILSPLAAGCLEDTAPESAARALEHFWRNRRLGRALISGPAYRVVLRAFAAEFELVLARLPGPRSRDDNLRPELIALQPAAGQLALIDAWLLGRSGHSPAQIARALHASGRASVMALIGPPPFDGHSRKPTR